MSQLQAVQDFNTRILELQQQHKDQRSAVVKAAHAAHAARTDLQAGKDQADELDQEKRSLQQAAEEMQQQLASNSQAIVAFASLLEVCEII